MFLFEFSLGIVRNHEKREYLFGPESLVFSYVLQELLDILKLLLAVIIKQGLHVINGATLLLS